MSEIADLGEAKTPSFMRFYLRSAGEVFCKPAGSVLYVFCILAICIVSCKKHSGATVAVHGNVSYRGEALKSARITFFPSRGRPVSAVVSNGEYEAELPPGDYTVAINVGSELPPGFKEGDPLPPPPKIILPETYSTRAKSTLQATVKPGQSEPIDFELK